MTANDHFKTPVLSRVTIRESKSIGIMFRMYDSNSAGSISPHYARKLLKALGLDSDTVDLPVTVSFRDFLIIVDKLVPPPNPPLRSSLDTFSHFVAVPDPVNGKLMITAGEMTNFIRSINGMKVSKTSSEILLHKMQEKNDYNDGNDQKVSIRIERFNNEVIEFAKKKSLFKSRHLKN